jgi:predicted extracellular nuclease
MKKPVASIKSPGQLTVLAALLAGTAMAPVASAVALAPPNIVITQVYGGGGNASAVYSHDFIEIFNRGSTTVNLAGMSVQYASSKGTSWSVTALPNRDLLPGQYLLIQEAAGANSPTAAPALPTPDVVTVSGGGATNSPSAMSATTGKVLLSSDIAAQSGDSPSGLTVLDLVGFGVLTGTSNVTGFETAPIGAATNTKAVRRKVSCTDTNDNSQDFEIVTPTPRNSAVTPVACTGGTTNALPEATCANLTLAKGTAGFVALSGQDSDGTVTGATITGASYAGIALGTVTAAGSNGGIASVNLNVDASVPAGVYPVAVKFSNNDSTPQSASCTATITVQAPAATVLTVAAAQGPGATSPYAGTTQTVEGVITMKLPGSGFYIQDQVATAGASSGIYVFGSTTSFLVGDLVRVTGTIFEYKPGTQATSYTEIKDATLITKQASVAPIAATNIAMPADLSQYQGMLVSFTNNLVINEVNLLGERGEMTLASVRREVPTNRYPAGSAGALAMAASNAADQIVLDDTIFSTPNPIPYIGEGQTVRVGDEVSHLVGVVDFASIGNGNYGYKLQPQTGSAVEISRVNRRTDAPVLAAGNVRVASANVLNFFTTMIKDGYSVISDSVTTGCTVGATTTWNNCRGADTREEFIRQRDKIVNELVALNADVVGLMEIQNNGDDAVSYLVSSVNARVGFPMYAYVPKPPTTGTDAIRVAMIYKPQALSLVGSSMSDSNAINNRHPIAQTFKAANGAKFSVIVNHLKSKGSCPSGTGVNADNGDSQGCWNGTRIQQATQLANNFIPAVQAAAADPDVLVIGDMNAHGFEDPINLLTAKGMVNELEVHVRPKGLVYSYVFDGESGYLDHALATASLHGQVADATEWHNNADEPEVIDYNFGQGNANTPKPQDLYVNNAYRASDHDPVVVSLNLTPTFFDSTSSFNIMRSGLALNRITGKYTGSLTFTNTTNATINGPFQVLFSGLSAGVKLDNKSGEQGGYPYLSVGSGSLAPGASATVSITFSNPGRVVIGYTPKIITGTF